jgi:ATP-dependent RNA helicase RhlE
MKFSDLRLIEPLLRAVAAAGYTDATPVQAQAIPHVLEGRDLLGCAQTGTGKTAAFALPLLQRLAANPVPIGHTPRVRCLILCPTRELATQIAGDFRTYGKHVRFRIATVFGGVNQNPQVQALRQGLDVLVATPGRLLDLIGQGFADLRNVETLVLDEADRMLDMGFINDIRKIVARLPHQKQTLLFSATMPMEIRKLADSLLRNPVGVQIAPPATTAAGIKESVYFVEKSNKPALLAHLVSTLPMTRAIVFTRTKHGADRVVRQLHSFGIRSEAIHGNKSQNARQRALDNFKACKIPVLVATDIASRGIDIDDVTHVVNFDISHEPDTYVHRIGRTARAGASGAAVSFCDREELPNLKGIEKLIRRSIPVKTDHPEYVANRPAASHHARTSHETPRHAAPARTSDGPASASHHAGARPAAHQHSGRPASLHRIDSRATAHAPHSRPAAAHPRQGGYKPAEQRSAEHLNAEPRTTGHKPAASKAIPRRLADQQSPILRRGGAGVIHSGDKGRRARA